MKTIEYTKILFSPHLMPVTCSPNFTSLAIVFQCSVNEPKGSELTLTHCKPQNKTKLHQILLLPFTH